nr:phosphate ABC transporter substrate-binding protein PstS [Microbacterium amylolyticum]
MTLAGCAANEGPAGNSNGNDSAETGNGSALTGTLSGIGASSMGAAQDAWTVGFQTIHDGVTVNYAPEGSGAGRENFISGAADFAGSDRAFHLEEIADNDFGACTSADIVEVPVYVSPVALAFNLPGIESLNMDPETIAAVFKGDIATWDDEQIAEQNDGVELPSLPITPVNRADTSGTTETFAEYMASTAPDVWDFEVSGDWPIQGTESGQQTAGVRSAVESGEGTIGYLDASQIPEGSGQVHVGVDGEYVPYSSDAASMLIEGSPLETGRGAADLVFDVNPAAAPAGSYPIALVSYAVACATYADADKAELVKTYLEYVVSAEGQEAAAEYAGSAPLSDSLRETVLGAISAIS